MPDTGTFSDANSEYYDWAEKKSNKIWGEGGGLDSHARTSAYADFRKKQVEGGSTSDKGEWETIQWLERVGALPGMTKDLGRHRENPQGIEQGFESGWSGGDYLPGSKPTDEERSGGKNPQREYERIVKNIDRGAEGEEGGFTGGGTGGYGGASEAYDPGAGMFESGGGNESGLGGRADMSIFSDPLTGLAGFNTVAGIAKAGSKFAGKSLMANIPTYLMSIMKNAVMRGLEGDTASAIQARMDSKQTAKEGTIDSEVAMNMPEISNEEAAGLISKDTGMMGHFGVQARKVADALSTLVDDPWAGLDWSKMGAEGGPVGSSNYAGGATYSGRGGTGGGVGGFGGPSGGYGAGGTGAGIGGFGGPW